MPPTEVIARPSFCTSLAPMCLSTSAAWSSPSDSSTTAARWTPLRIISLRGSAIGFDPVAYDAGDPLGVVADRGLGDLQLLVEIHRPLRGAVVVARPGRRGTHHRHPTSAARRVG